MNKLYKFVNGKRVKALKDKECDTCKQPFSPNTSKNKYCCKECYYEMKRIRKDRVVWTDEMRASLSEKYTGRGNPSWGRAGWSKGKKRWEISGENHWAWKGGYSIDKNGYKVIQNNRDTLGEKILEHRKVWVEANGEIPSGYVIHHINGNKLDNRLENLRMVTRQEHIELHRDEISILGCEVDGLIFRNVSEACYFFGKSKSSFYRMIRKGKEET